MGSKPWNKTIRNSTPKCYYNVCNTMSSVNHNYSFFLSLYPTCYIFCVSKKYFLILCFLSKKINRIQNFYFRELTYPILCSLDVNKKNLKHATYMPSTFNLKSLNNVCYLNHEQRRDRKCVKREASWVTMFCGWICWLKPDSYSHGDWRQWCYSSFIPKWKKKEERKNNFAK